MKSLRLHCRRPSANNLTKVLHFFDEMRRQEEVYGLTCRVSFQSRPEGRGLCNPLVDEMRRHLTILDHQHLFHVRGSDASEALIGPAQGVGREDNVVEF